MTVATAQPFQHHRRMFLLFIAVVREYLFQFFIRGCSDALLVPVYGFKLLH
jgi:hypothetical protein